MKAIWFGLAMLLALRVLAGPDELTVTLSRDVADGAMVRVSDPDVVRAALGTVDAWRTLTIGAALPEGRYLVRVDTLGGSGEMRVSAEARRAVCPPLRLGRETQTSFTVWRLSDRLAEGEAITLTGREEGILTYDDLLTLRIEWPDTDELERLRLTITPDDEPGPSVFLAGDSTVTDQPGAPWSSWGAMIPMHFDATVGVANLASSGRALRSFRAEHRLNKLLELVRGGDYVFLQFGHNDQKEKGEGIGPYLSYTEDLNEYITRVQERGATPVLVTPVVRRRFDKDGNWYDTLGDYADAVRKVAASRGVPLIDLHARSRALVESLGPEGSIPVYVHRDANPPLWAEPIRDDTHFSTYGGALLAASVADAIRENPELSSLAARLRADVPVPGAPAEISDR